MFRATLERCFLLVRQNLALHAAILAATIGSATATYAATESPDATGTWTAERNDDRLYLQLNRRPRFNYGFTVATTQLVGGDDRWRLERDAGVFELRGVFDGRDGGGTFVFRANPAFRKGLIDRDLGPIEDRELVHLAAIDMSLEFIDGLRALGYRERLKRLTEMRIHGVTPEYIRDLSELDYEKIAAKRLVKMRIHKVTPAYIRELKSLGYASLPPKRLVEMRIHRVEPEFIRALADLGYRDISARRLTEMRIHGVDPAYVRDVRKLGLEPSSRDLVEMRIHGIDVEFLNAMRTRGYGRLTTRQAVELRIHGVRPSFVDDLKELGYEKVSTRELIDLRIHGVGPEWIKRAIARRDERPSVRRLIELKIHGMN